MGVALRTMTGSVPAHRIEICFNPNLADPKAQHLLKAIKEFLHARVQSIAIVRVYTIYKALNPQQLEGISNGPLLDPIAECLAKNISSPKPDWAVEVGYKEGVTDNAARTAQSTIEDFLGEQFDEGEFVRATAKYLFWGQLSRQDVERIAKEFLANPLIEDIHIASGKNSTVDIIDIAIADEELMALSQKRQLALNLPEMQAIRQYFTNEETTEERRRVGLPSNPTDVELEAIAQTWSEHCKHKIFNAEIRYKEDGKSKIIKSLFQTYIKKSTEELAKKIDWLISVFSDNAGIIRFNENYSIAFKVETHNSPSALDPYGGALTGILGVNRDIMGAGNGARLIANTDVLCFAPPTYNGAIPKRLQHPKRVFEGVRKGIEHGGNKSGIPTVNGAILFDDRYLGKPLVYCGSIGIMPATVHQKPTHRKEIFPGDLIVVAGGRTGKDGIHGAIFSSEELNAASPSSAVQIGDPFTQKKLHDFLLEARDAGLFRTLTDNGAGGFSSSVGELALLCGGSELHLDRAPLKYKNLLPWEILLSESQERMTLAVPPECKEKLANLGALYDVETAVLGTFTDTGRFHAFFRGETVALLNLEFFHNGLPPLQLDANWTSKPETVCKLPSKAEMGKELHQILARFNICSKESIVRQYDHEVQGGSVLKPFVGLNADGPGDAAVVQPIELMMDQSTEGIVLSNGICPKYSDLDTYHMAANAIDEAIRNCVAVGGDPERIAILDNFCWPDPIYDPLKTPDGKYKLAQLVRANEALYSYSQAFETPIISGKDSMKNDYKIDASKISIPPTLLISAIGKIRDIRKCVTMDVKHPGDWIYVIGITRNELGGSEYAAMFGVKGGVLPKVDAQEAKMTYIALHQSMENSLVASCHDCSDGGLGVCLAEMAIAGCLGMDIDLNEVIREGNMTEAEILFSETASRFAVAIDPSKADAFEDRMQGRPFKRIGKVRDDGRFLVRGLRDGLVIDEEVHHLKASWMNTLLKVYE